MIQFDPPAGVVDTLVVHATERDQVVQVGRAVVFPFDDVVDIAVIEPNLAHGARFVHHSESSPLSVGSGAMLPAHGKRSTIGA